ncbi:hypothetical protein NBO_844g0001 [Nosema bombycis CQ1]|uniref:Uncharacterized protein n=1 Tax=Nosema bombycis (strain CQ1 / CVCC 102059) TaxID=578461 RepID=R0M180_NOSB1|nr:hypothetical protein NBO_844g0001 [Nosema bombycis CQ1]|eukprot:EOB11784.1 hypothetical protein NBO_844g0001 [Nosema bombycis CQ1]
MPDFSKIIKLLGNNIYKIITCTFDKCQPVLVQISNDIVTITCNDDVDNAESSDLEDADDLTFCLRVHVKKAVDDFSYLFSERYSKILSKKKLKDTVHEFGEYVLESMITDLLLKELEVPLDFNFIKSLKSQLKNMIPAKKLTKSLKEYQHFKNNAFNYDLCCSKLKNSIISGLRDPTKIEFEKNDCTSQFIDSIAKHSVEILNEWRD